MIIRTRKSFFKIVYCTVCVKCYSRSAVSRAYAEGKEKGKGKRKKEHVLWICKFCVYVYGTV